MRGAAKAFQAGALKHACSRIVDWRPGGARGNDDPDLHNEDQFLAALRYVRPGDGREMWEYHVVTVDCDEDYWELRVNGEPWDYAWRDVEWWIPLSEFRLPTISFDRR